MMLADSLMGPLNFREYSTKEDTSPMEMPFARYRREPNTDTSAREMLLMKLTVGPTMVP